MRTACQCPRRDHEVCADPYDCICGLHDAPDAEDRAVAKADDNEDDGPRRKLDEYDAGGEW